jgi:stringent starvation protein B
MSELSTKPYLLRAIYEWCTDSGYTPYLAVRVDGNTRVPMEFVRNGEIVLNISFAATNGLKMENDHIRFSARFGGVSRDLYIPVDNVLAIYANENNQGMAFDVGEHAGRGRRLRRRRRRDRAGAAGGGAFGTDAAGVRADLVVGADVVGRRRGRRAGTAEEGRGQAYSYPDKVDIIRSTPA